MSSTNVLETNQTLTIINLVATVPSVIGCIWVSYHCFRMIRKQRAAIKLILGIALSDLMFSIANLMMPWDAESHTSYCQAEGFIRNCFTVMSICFATSTALLTYQNSKQDPAFHHRRFIMRATLASILISLVFSLPPFFMREIIYGRTDVYCWVAYSPSEGNSLTDAQTMTLLIALIFDVVPIFSGLILTLVGYTLAIINYKKLDAEHHLPGLHNAYKLFWYPATLFIISVPGIINDGINLGEWLSITHLASFHLIGFLNALIFAVQTKAWRNAKIQETLFVENDSTFIDDPL